jgi:excinuclease ABC subunit C
MAQFEFVPERYPTTPGCYLMKDNRGKIIYLGKSKNLRSRLSSYFRPHPESRHVRELVSSIAEIEVILVNNETESLILENNLIDRYRPAYNRLLWRADRGYPYIVLTDEEYPRLVPYQENHLNRELGDAGIRKQFGPYLSHRFRKCVLDLSRDQFRLRTCDPLPDEVCLRFHVHRCSGVCAGAVSAEQHADDVERAIAFLSANKYTDVIREMKRRMQAHADNLEFESAQDLKEQIAQLESALEKQVVDRIVEHDQDVIYFGDRHALVARIERGALQGLTLFDLDSTTDLDEACKRFILSRYRSNSPEELLVNRMRNANEVAKSLRETIGRAVRVVLPEKGIGRELLGLCRINYEYRVSHSA